MILERSPILSRKKLKSYVFAFINHEKKSDRDNIVFLIDTNSKIFSTENRFYSFSTGGIFIAVNIPFNVVRVRSPIYR